MNDGPLPTPTGAIRRKVPASVSPHAFTLRSENPSLLVELEMKPGTHARIGSSPSAEVCLPLAGLESFACVLGRNSAGKFYVEDMDGQNARLVAMPGFLSLAEYRFELLRQVPASGLGPISKVAPGAAVPVAEILVEDENAEEEPAVHGLAENFRDVIHFILDRFKKADEPS